MSTGFVTFLLATTAAILVWHFVFYLVPAIARVRFVHHISALRDQVYDAVLTGEVEDSDHARQLIRKYESFERDVRELSFMHLYAMHTSLKEVGIDPKDLALKPCHVSPEDQLYLDEVEEQAKRHLARRMVSGSALWPVLLITQGCFRMVRLVAKSARPPVSPMSLADEYSEATDNRLVRDAMGTPAFAFS